jgi:hypothetical protein
MWHLPVVTLLRQQLPMRLQPLLTRPLTLQWMPLLVVTLLLPQLPLLTFLATRPFLRLTLVLKCRLKPWVKLTPQFRQKRPLAKHLPLTQFRLKAKP